MKYTKIMVEKYKLMSLAAAVCTLLGVNSTDAGVTLTFEQSGVNVTATWSGTFDLTNTEVAFTNPPDQAVAMLSQESAIGNGGGAFSVAFMGTAIYLASISEIMADSTYVGDTFGFTGSALMFDSAASGVFAPTGTMTFLNTTLEEMGVDSFNNTLAFQGSGNINGSQEIRYTTVGVIPEPSSALLLGVGALAVAFNRRRR